MCECGKSADLPEIPVSFGTRRDEQQNRTAETVAAAGSTYTQDGVPLRS